MCPPGKRIVFLNFMKGRIKMTSPSHFKSFGSDNFAGIHPDILRAVSMANTGHAPSYGNDIHTQIAVQKFKKHFGDLIDVYFVMIGTAANVLAIKSVTDSYHAVICAETAHINVDECGAPEKHTGCKLLPLPTRDGKVSVDKIQQHMHGIGFEHHAQPRVLSITQPTELGTVYSIDELKTLTDYAHRHDLIVHMDGARLANAAAYLGAGLKELTVDVGIDVLSFGGTKNGMMMGEAVVFFDSSLSKNFKYIRKQEMQLVSKMRFISAQFEAYLSDDLWLENAAHANRMACLLADRAARIPGIQITRPVQANAVFSVVPPEHIPVLQEKYFFYVWDENISEVRWMTSFDTTESDVDRFVGFIERVLR